MQRQRNLDPDGLSTSLQNEQQELQESGGGVMDMVTKVLDANRDGSIIDEVISFIGGLLGQRRSQAR